MLDIHIRKTKISDIPVIMNLLKKTDFLTQDSLYDTPEYFKNSIKQGIFFVAESDDNVIGMIHGERLMCDGAVIWYFVVDENLRSLGIGKMLLNKFQEYCKKHGIKWMFGSADINKRTKAFYAKNGYHFSGKYIEFTKNL